MSVDLEILLHLEWDHKSYNQPKSFMEVKASSSILVFHTYAAITKENDRNFPYKVVSFFNFPIDAGRIPLSPMLLERSLHSETNYQEMKG